jgi:hypothetical protein
MKIKLLFTKQNSFIFYMLFVFCLCFNYSWSQNLIANPTCDLHGTGAGSTSDNADSYDMTPNNTIKDESGNDIPSPYQAVWDNDALEDWLEVFYLGAAGSLDEQPGSTSSGNEGTRGVKLYDDGSPSITGCSRRIYQKVVGLSIGVDYTFSVDSRSEAIGTDSEVYILNTEITDEVGINANGGADSSVDGFMSITDDFDTYTTNTLSFTATTTSVVVYIRSLNSVDESTEVFYDNFSLDLTLSTDKSFETKFKVYPNPATDQLTIETNNINLSSIEVYDLLGKKVFEQNKLSNNTIDISDLSNGIYLLTIKADNKSLTKKLVIK